jgi:uncharacterized protein with HEPN domain
MQEDDRLYLQHMRDHAKKACELVAGKRQSDFDADEVLRLALSHLIQIIGEAANHVSHSQRQAHPEIPWQDIVGMRHRLVHGYFEVDQDIVWQTVTVELGPLAVTLDRILGLSGRSH